MTDENVGKTKKDQVNIRGGFQPQKPGKPEGQTPPDEGSGVTKPESSEDKKNQTP